ncbi:unnamed protein product [Arctogadus glacialis]
MKGGSGGDAGGVAMQVAPFPSAPQALETLPLQRRGEAGGRQQAREHIAGPEGRGMDNLRSVHMAEQGQGDGVSALSLVFCVLAESSESGAAVPMESSGTLDPPLQVVLFGPTCVSIAGIRRGLIVGTCQSAAE